MDLPVRKILITGGARRIGRSLALAGAGKGADLVIHHNQSPAEASSLQQEIQALGSQAQVVQCDFSVLEEVENFTEEVFSSGQIDAVVNNASIFSDLNWETSTASEWNKHQQINLLAPFLISQSFAKNLPPGKQGRIINLLDWRALRPGPDHLPYTISKAGLAALTKSLAISLAPAILVNGLALGAILPPSDGGEVEDLVSQLPVPRWADLSEVQAAFIFLLSSPDYITGEIIHVDGGRHLI